MQSESLDDKIRRLASEPARMVQEEEIVRSEAQQELDKTISEIERSEEKRETLEAFLNTNDNEKRLQHGTIRNLYFDTLSKNPSGLTSSQIKDLIEREQPGMRLGSVPASLSYQMAQGRLRRDNHGRYLLPDSDKGR